MTVDGRPLDRQGDRADREPLGVLQAEIEEPAGLAREPPRPADRALHAAGVCGNASTKSSGTRSTSRNGSTG